MGDIMVLLLTLTSAFMEEGKENINVEILINAHRHSKPSPALCKNISSSVSYLVILRVIFPLLSIGEL